MPESERFGLSRAAAAAFAKDGSLAGVKKDWVTAEWLDFLANLPKAMTPAQMKALDDAFGLRIHGIIHLHLKDEVGASLEIKSQVDAVLHSGQQSLPRPIFGYSEDTKQEHQQCSHGESQFPA